MHRSHLCRYLLMLPGILLMLSVGCGDVFVQEPVTQDPLPAADVANGGIRGQVLPVNVSASVLLIHAQQILVPIQVDAEGQYQVQDLPPGEYDLEIIAPHHFVDISQRGLLVEAGRWTEAEIVSLRPWSDAALLSGQVVDAATGEPIQNAGVLVECTTNVCSPLSAATDAVGIFRLDLWPDIASNVTVRKIGYQTEQIRVLPLGVKGKQHLEIRLQPNP